jgi:hypothetical protein
MIAAFVVAVALPARVASWIARALGADRVATRLRDLTSDVQIAAYVVTGLIWVPLVAIGVCYPATDAGNLQNSWGGPTLVGAWLTHLAGYVGVLLAVSSPFALRKRTRTACDTRPSE